MSSAPRPGRCGAVTRITSAPCAASVRPHTGPAMTRVRSSTRTPDSGRSAAASGAGGASPMRVISSSGSARDRLALRVRGPLGRRAHHGGDQPGLGGGRLERLGVPFEQRRLHRLALVGAAAAASGCRRGGAGSWCAAAPSGRRPCDRRRRSCPRAARGGLPAMRACSARCGTRSPRGACRPRRSGASACAVARSRPPPGPPRRCWPAPTAPTRNDEGSAGSAPVSVTREQRLGIAAGG